MQQQNRWILAGLIASALLLSPPPGSAQGQGQGQGQDPDFQFKKAQTHKSARQKQQEAMQRLQAIQNGQPIPEPSSIAIVTTPALSVQPPAGIGLAPGVNINIPNFANSPNLRKFVDSLPGLDPAGANNLGNYLPVAVPDTTTYPGSDYYVIALVEYTQQMHSDLPPTKLRGYAQLNGGDGKPHYLGPIIVATKDRPVRVWFKNQLPTGAGGNLFLPVDAGLMGAGMGPQVGTQVGNYTENRGTLHLHGGRTPWISDGTPHQWTVPAGETTTLYPKGAAAANVPDMPPAGPGEMTFYWSNGQSARLMFYHDHAYGITRLNVYAGEAAGYLITDPTEQTLINGGTLGTTTIAPVTLPNIGIPMVIQDRTFINDANTQTATAANLSAAWGNLYTPTPQTDIVDPLWKNVVPGGLVGGNLWMPHEYMINENPFDPRGYNDMGRWDYGPWMNPPLAVQNIQLPSPSIVPELFMDTMTINGQAFPYVELPPAAVRFRILNACNDRMLNLQLYKAQPLTVKLANGGAGYIAPVVTFSGGGASVQGTATATVVGGVITAINLTSTGTGYTSAPTVNISDSVTPSSVAVAYASAGTEVHMVDAVNPLLPNPNWPATWPSDGRPGGVPDPLAMGPHWYQIGNEGGFLAKVADIPPQPIDFDYNRKDVTVLDITSQSLFLPPAVRADVVVDLSAYQDGDTLILYNDAPAPAPLFDPRYDYYTDDLDQTASGGAPTTAPGFGPNTRTVMQIRIKAALSAPTWAGLPALQAALPAAFAAGQDQIIVPNSAYNAAYNTTLPDIYAGVLDNTLNLTGSPQSVAAVQAVLPGQGYTTAPTVTFVGGGGSGAAATATLNGVTGITITANGVNYSANPTITIANAAGGTGTGATAAAQVTGGTISGITILNPGSGYLIAPNVTITDPTGTGAAATANITLGSVGAINVTAGGTGYTKAPYVYLTGGGGLGAQADALLTGAQVMTGKNLTEGFDREYGRLNILLGSTPNPLTPLVGLGPIVGLSFYVDPPTEYLTPDVPVLWRLSHLGVDSHAMHFHLFDLQVVNRVDWVGIINYPPSDPVHPPRPEEVGWKDTIRTDPFNDLIVALRPTAAAMKLPFGLPRSSRLLDPTMTNGASANFSQVAPPPGVPAAGQITNVVTDFGWEYVWHCHLLGHEENDMMRPIVFDVPATVPTAPTLSADTSSYNATLNWTDPTPYNYATGQPTSTLGNPMNEIGFRIMRGTGTTGALTQIGTALANQTTFTDTTAVPGTTYRYQVVIYNAAGSTPSNTLRVTVPILTITTTSLPGGIINIAYSQTLAASGGPLPYTWAITTGALPGGLTLDPAKGLISGTPTILGTFNFTVSVTDARKPTAATATRALSITITPPWSYVQTAAASVPKASHALAFGSATKSGDLIIVQVSWVTSSSFVSISDSQGNVYTQVGSEQTSSAVGVKSRLYYAKNIKAGKTTITSVVSGRPGTHQLFIHEYSGLSTTSPLDAYSVAVGSGAGAAFTSGILTTTGPSDLLYGIAIDAGLATAATGWTVRSTLMGNAAADKMQTGAGTAAFTGSSGGAYIAWIAAFK